MMKRNMWINKIMVVLLVLGIVIPSIGANAATGWACDEKGWYYYNGSDYYYNQWAEISGYWYYFTNNGYMDYSEYRDGCWLNADGSWNTLYGNGMWKSDSKGWWYEDNGWYPVGQWLWIDGSCYYFDNTGYMENNCFRDGYYLTGSGAWDFEESNGKWTYDGTGWRFDTKSFHARNIGLWIDGDYYWFNENGYYDEEKTNQQKKEGNMGKSSSYDPGFGDYEDQSDNDYYYGDNLGKKNTAESVSVYSYEVIPLLEPFNNYYYIKTDNPDPDSFRFVDVDTNYPEDGTIVLNKTIYADVKYEDVETRRVNGGYIFIGGNVDGGEVKLQAQTPVRAYNSYNLSTGEVTKEYIYEYEDTSITVNLPRLMNNIDYLIETYGDPTKPFFDNLSGIQKGFSSICLYGGVSVLEN